MSLDKLTINAQLALLAQNAKSLDEAIAVKTKAIHEATVDLERTRGARAYHDLLVQQVNNQIAEIDRAAQATASESTT
jgi:hypothetical protein